MIENFKAFILALSFWLILLSPSINLPGIDFGYLDELLVISLALPLFLNIKEIQSNGTSKIWFFILLFILTNLALAPFSHFFRGYKLATLDIFLFLKPVVFLLGFARLSYKIRYNFIKLIASTGTIFTYVAFLLYPVNLVFNFFPAFDNRLGLNSYSFITANPGTFLNILLLIGSTVLLEGNENTKKITLYIIAFLILTTLRFKGFVMLSAAILILYYFDKKAKGKQLAPILRNRVIFKTIKKPQILFILALALIPGWQQFKNYFLGDITPRLLFIKTAVEIGINNFPFGTGPGSFGSTVAKNWYSPLYLKYGFDSYYGLSSDGETDFLSDNFWPMVIAQYGAIGLVLTFLIYRLLIIWLSKHLIPIKYTIEIFIISLISLILSTMGSAILVGSIGLLYMMILGSIITIKKS